VARSVAAGVVGAIVLFACSSEAADRQPGWKRIGETSTFTIYEDTNSAKVASTSQRPYVVEMRFVVDFKPGQQLAGPGVASIDGRSQFDCDTHEILDISSDLYDGHMASGQIVARSPASPGNNWTPAQQTPLGQLAWTAACGISQ
jgi:hypothetical protein